jgi:hypothetical protein
VADVALTDQLRHGTLRLLNGGIPVDPVLVGRCGRLGGAAGRRRGPGGRTRRPRSSSLAAFPYMSARVQEIDAEVQGSMNGRQRVLFIGSPVDARHAHAPRLISETTSPRRPSVRVVMGSPPMRRPSRDTRGCLPSQSGQDGGQVRYAILGLRSGGSPIPMVVECCHVLMHVARRFIGSL